MIHAIWVWVAWTARAMSGSATFSDDIGATTAASAAALGYAGSVGPDPSSPGLEHGRGLQAAHGRRPHSGLKVRSLLAGNVRLGSSVLRIDFSYIMLLAPGGHT